jgi:small-conductance mechanosensitive channel
VVPAVLAVVPAASSDAERVAVCGPPEDGNWFCTQVYRATGSRRSAEIADALEVPVRIVLVLLVAWVVARVLQRVVGRVAQRIRDRGSMSLLGAGARFQMSESARLRYAQRASTISGVLRNIVGIAVWSVAGLIVLGEVGIDLAPILAGAGVAGIAIGFGTQTLVRDYLAGVFVVLEDQYGVGDEIEVGAVQGTVEWVSLRMTRVRDAEGVAWHIGNGEIRAVGNRSQREPSTGEHDARRSDGSDRPDAGAVDDQGTPDADR